MIKAITRGVYRRGLRCLEQGDLDGLLRRFDEHCTFSFAGNTPLGAQLSNRQDIRTWFERFRRLLPDPTFEVDRVVVDGPPWNQRLAARVVIRSTVAGAPYQNHFAQFLRLRWGRVTDDAVLEDTQTWADACRRLLAAGVAEAGQPGLGALDRVT
jgi:ketosteroid isomerase-like protein